MAATQVTTSRRLSTGDRCWAFDQDGALYPGVVGDAQEDGWTITSYQGDDDRLSIPRAEAHRLLIEVDADELERGDQVLTTAGDGVFRWARVQAVHPGGATVRFEADPDLRGEVHAIRPDHLALLPICQPDSPAKSDPAGMLTIAQVADRCGVTEGNVRAWISDGALEAVHCGRCHDVHRRAWRITQAALDRFLAGRTLRPSEPTPRGRRRGWAPPSYV